MTTTKAVGYAAAYDGEIRSKLYSKIGFAKRWLSDRKRATYKEPDKWGVVELSVTKTTALVDLIPPKKLLELLNG